jgi:steroid delta-isomerase-like uncharacterized protein
MSEQNKQVARRFLQAFADGDLATLKQIVIEDIVDHNAPPGAAPGRQGLLDAVERYRAGFPDMKLLIEREVAEGDLVVVYGMVTGTNTGPMMGAPATGKRAAFAYMDMYRISDGKVVETWHVENIVAMLAQLGLMPR